LFFIFQGQPIRWLLVYFTIFLTGICTVLYHYDTYNVYFGLADVGGNIAIALAFTLTALWDYEYSKVTRSIVTVTTLCVSLATVITYAVTEGSHVFGSFSVGHMTVVLLFALVLLLNGIKWREIQPISAKWGFVYVSLLFILATMCTILDDRKIVSFWALHSMWHSGVGVAFMIVFVVNYVRFPIIEEHEDYYMYDELPNGKDEMLV
jgi:hypothetical protein